MRRMTTPTVLGALHGRRSIREFTPREVSRAEIETMLDAAVTAPNHRLTQPWRFYVLGPEARRAYGFALGNRKAKKIEDPAAAETMRNNVANEHMALPLMIAVAVVEDQNPEIREEDASATMMAIQNISIAAVALGLGTHMKTGAVMQDPAARAAAGVRDGERIVALINVGEPTIVPPAKERKGAASLTTWLP
jgi:nitroreductase